MASPVARRRIVRRRRGSVLLVQPRLPVRGVNVVLNGRHAESRETVASGLRRLEAIELGTSSTFRCNAPKPDGEIVNLSATSNHATVKICHAA